MGKVKAFGRKIRNEGVASAVQAMLVYIERRLLFREYLLFYAEISEYNLDAGQINPDITVTEIKRLEEISLVNRDQIVGNFGREYLEKIERRLNNNWRYFVAFIHGSIAGECWVLDRKSNIRTNVVPIHDGDAALIDAFTMPKFRGQRVYPFLLASITLELRNEGLKRAYGFVNNRNGASIKGFFRAGFRYVIAYETYRFFGKEVVVWKKKDRKWEDCLMENYSIYLKPMASGKEKLRNGIR